MRIYTRMGDAGETYCAALGSRVPKDHPLIEFMGALDEANSFIGLAAQYCVGSLAETLEGIQRLLFKIGFSLSGHGEVSEGDVEWLERLVDEYMEGVELKGFIIPGGDACTSHIQVARTIVRRAERRLVAAINSGVTVRGGEAALRMSVKALNRMSDTLFAIAVGIQHRSGGLKYL